MFGLLLFSYLQAHNGDASTENYKYFNVSQCGGILLKYWILTRRFIYEFLGSPQTHTHTRQHNTLFFFSETK